MITWQYEVPIHDAEKTNMAVNHTYTFVLRTSSVARIAMKTIVLVFKSIAELDSVRIRAILRI